MSLDGASLGRAFGEIVISTNVAAAVADAQRAFDSGIASIGQGLQRLGDNVSAIGARLTALTAPIDAFIVSGVNAASNFGSAMAEIQARTQLTAEEMENVRAVALQMGADTAFSAQQAADAFLQLLSSGQTAEEALATLPAVLEGAAASGEDLGRTADLVTNILAQFQLGVDQSGRAVDVLARAAGASSATMGSLGEAFNDAGAVASGFGLSVEQTAAAFAVFAENGIQGSEAGNQLRSMLQNMTRDTDDVKGAWNELGVSFYDAQGNTRDLDTVLDELDAALDGLPVEDQNRLMQTLAGTYGVTGLRALRAAGGIDGMMASMDASASSADVAAARMNTFEGRVDSFRGSIETLQINAFTPFLQTMAGPLIARLTSVINKIGEWAAANPVLVSRMIAVASVIGVLAPALIFLGLAISTIGTAVTGLGAIFGGLTVGSLLPFIAVAGALYLAWRTNFLGIRDLVENVVGRVINVFKLLTDGLAYTFDQLRTGSGIFDAIRYGLGQFIDQIFEAMGFSEQASDRIQTAFFRVLNSVENVFNGIRNRVSGFIADVRQAFAAMSSDNPITKALALATNPIARVFFVIQTLVNGFIADVRQAFEVLGSDNPLVRSLAEATNPVARVLLGIQDTIRRVIGALRPLFAEIGEFIGRAVSGIGETLGRIDFGQLFKIGSILLSLTSPVGQVMTILRLFGINAIDIFETVVGGVTRFFAAINDGGSVFDGLTAAIPALGGFFDFAQSVFNDIVNIVTTILIPGLQQLANWFTVDVMPAVIGFITGTIVPAIQGFFSFIQAAAEMVIPALQQFANWFLVDVMPAVIGFITGVVIPAIQSFFNFLGQIWAIASPALLALADWFLSTGLPAIQQFISGTVIPFITEFVGALVRIWNDVSPFLIQLFDWFVNTGLPLVVSYINDFVLPVIQGFIDLLAGIWATVSPVLTQLYDWFITAALPTIMAFIEGPFTSVIQGFIDLLAGIWGIIEPGLNGLRDGFNTVFGFIKDNVIQPFIDLINSILGVVQDVVGGVTTAIATVTGAVDQAKANVQMGGQIVQGASAHPDRIPQALGVAVQSIGNEIGNLFRASGGPVSAGKPYIVGERGPEAMVPGMSGTVVSNDQLMSAFSGMMGGGSDAPTSQSSGGDMIFNPGSVVVQANSAAEGAAAADGFMQRMDEMRRAQG